MSRTGLVAAGVAMAVPAVLGVSVAQAEQTAPATSTITATPSDPTPASGQTFTVRGKFTIGGSPAGNHVVRIGRLVQGNWQPVQGATETTASNGTYSIKVNLQSTGKRVLRAVGVGQGSESNARKRFTVTVH